MQKRLIGFLAPIALLATLPAGAEGLDLQAYASGLDPAAHARFEAAFVLDQLPRQMNQLADALESTDQAARRARLVEVSHYAGWMAFRFSRAASAHPRDRREAFNTFAPCHDAVAALQDLALAHVRRGDEPSAETWTAVNRATVEVDTMARACAGLVGPIGN